MRIHSDLCATVCRAWGLGYHCNVQYIYGAVLVGNYGMAGRALILYILKIEMSVLWTVGY